MATGEAPTYEQDEAEAVAGPGLLTDQDRSAPRYQCIARRTAGTAVALARLGEAEPGGLGGRDDRTYARSGGGERRDGAML